MTSSYDVWNRIANYVDYVLFLAFLTSLYVRKCGQPLRATADGQDKNVDLSPIITKR